MAIKVNPETQSFHFHTKFNNNYFWNHVEKVVESPKGCDPSGYLPESVKRYISGGHWIPEGEPVKMLYVPCLMALDVVPFGKLESDIITDGLVEYTVEWDNSNDFGPECLVEVKAVTLMIDDDQVDFPLALLGGTVEHLKDYLIEHELKVSANVIV